MIVLLAALGAHAAEVVVVESLLVDVRDERLAERLEAISGSTTAFGPVWSALVDDERVEVVDRPLLLAKPDEPARQVVEHPEHGRWTLDVRAAEDGDGLLLRSLVTVNGYTLDFGGPWEEGALRVETIDHRMLLQRVHVVDDADALLRASELEQTLADEALAELRPWARRRWLDHVLDEAAEESP
jgi:hypothetical protein